MINSLFASLYILVGTYTSGESRGIYTYRFDPATARTELVGVAEVANPSYMAAHGDVVYAVSENGNAADSVSAFRLLDNGRLELINSTATGSSPCYVTATARMVVTANYGSGDVSVFGVKKNGGLTPQRQRLSLADKSASHMHCVRFSPDGKYLFATDLGANVVLRWSLRRGKIDERSLRTFEVAGGPRHFIFAGQSLYLITEMGGQVVAFDYNKGELVQRQVIDIDPADGGGSADIALSRNGKWLYGSNRLKNDGVAIVEVGERLNERGYTPTGGHPRNLSLSPDGRFLLVSCRDSNAVQVFAVDEAAGTLALMGRDINVNSPVCIMFLAK